MNYRKPSMLEALVERYVLGTMPMRARRRFDRLFEEDADVRQRVYALEKTLLPTIWALPPVQPSALVWARIARNLKSPPRRSRWPAIAAAAMLAFVATTIGWWLEVQEPPPETAIAVVNNAAGEALWLARVYPEEQRVDVQVTNAPTSQPENDYELWVLGGDGVPVSMGLLPQSGERELALSDTAVAALASGDTLAVSLEPLGGSPQAVPTGPVLFTAALLAP